MGVIGQDVAPKAVDGTQAVKGPAAAPAGAPVGFGLPKEAIPVAAVGAGGLAVAAKVAPSTTNKVEHKVEHKVAHDHTVKPGRTVEQKVEPGKEAEVKPEAKAEEKAVAKNNTPPILDKAMDFFKEHMAAIIITAAVAMLIGPKAALMVGGIATAWNLVSPEKRLAAKMMTPLAPLGLYQYFKDKFGKKPGDNPQGAAPDKAPTHSEDATKADAAQGPTALEQKKVAGL
jgi:hypothetical protein